jgi:hypothetical protein
MMIEPAYKEMYNNDIIDTLPFDLCFARCTEQVIARKSLAAGIPKKETGIQLGQPFSI